VTVRTLNRRYPYGTSFGGRGGLATFGGSFSLAESPRDFNDTSRPHPYFDFLRQHPELTYGQESYGAWARTLPPTTPIPPTPPPQGVFPNDPSSPSGQAQARGGASAVASIERDRGAPAPASTRWPAGSTLESIVAAGGSATPAAAGKPVVVDFNGQRYFFDPRTGEQIPGAGTGAGTGAGAGAGGSRVGSTINGRTASGQSVTGTITSDDASGTTVRWSDGTISRYDPSGNLVSSTAPPGSGGGASATGGAGGTGRTVGQTVTAKDATGATVNGTITEVRPDGTFTVRWANGTDMRYDATGKLVPTPPPPPPPPAPPETVPPGSAASNTLSAGDVTATGSPAPVTDTGVAAGSAASNTLTAGDTAGAALGAGAAGALGAVAGATSLEPPAVGAGTDISLLEGPVAPPPTDNTFFAPPPTAGPGGTTPFLDVGTAVSNLGAVPPPDTSVTIPDQFAVQLPPPVDQTGLAAGDTTLI